MNLDPLDRVAENVMRRWVLPACFAAPAIFCLVLARYAMLDGHWSAAVVLAMAALVLASLADQARRTDR